jgi:ubiquinone/menaquinone biosynthesis C-methylase UbiE
MRVWMDAVLASVNPSGIRAVLDVGCGTGRFLQPLREAFACDIVGIDRSLSMLQEAQHLTSPGVRLVQCDIAHMPIRDGCFDLAFMSMVYHHFSIPGQALLEIRRMLRGSRFLCIRNSTRTTLEGVLYVQFFPSALEYIRTKLPSQEEVLSAATHCGFVVRDHKVVDHIFADSGEEYLDKISHRACSDLLAVPDDEFRSGVDNLKQALSFRNEKGPITEPIDLFVFQVASTGA